MNIITQHRKAKGYSQTELAKILGVSQVTVTHWETGKVFPQGKNLMKLSEVLDVSAMDIVKSRGA